MVKVGDPVIYVDPMARSRAAIVTAVWGGPWSEERKRLTREQGVGTPEEIEAAIAAAETAQPSLNVVFVAVDETRHDSYGLQIERATSVPHQSVQQAHGNYWAALEAVHLA